MYSFDSKVRYSEVDHNCNMDLSTIINYFQDCSCFQSEALGVGVDYAKQRNCSWLLHSWQIIVHRFPKFGEYITTSTWAYGFDALYGYRNYKMITNTGELLAVANSTWIYVDLKSARPQRLTQDIIGVYPIEPKYENMEYSSRKLPPPEHYITYDAIPVLMHHIDSNEHMNNGQYIKLAQQYLPTDFKIWQTRVEYKRQALLGDLLIPRVSIRSNVYTVAFVNTEGKPYCVIEFTTKA